MCDCGKQIKKNHLMLHFDDIVFGPIRSRRLGSSLGVNILPSKGKLCNFDCIYCECGWNKDGSDRGPLPSYDDVKAALEAKITALAEAGIIPERVYNVRSACLSRSRSYENATGHYDYTQVAPGYFSIGICSRGTGQGSYYLCATPEKALCDLILSTPGLRLQSVRAAREYLEIYLRADMDAIARMDADIISACAATAGKKKTDLRNLEKFIRYGQPNF